MKSYTLMATLLARSLKIMHKYKAFFFKVSDTVDSANLNPFLFHSITDLYPLS